MSATRISKPALDSESCASTRQAESTSFYRPNGATFFAPTLESLAATQLIRSLGGITQEYLLKNPGMELPLKATLDALAVKAARLLLHGDTAAAEAMVAENPAILYCVVEEAKDHRGNKVKGTLLSIAALASDWNIREKHIPEKDHGIVERLKAYLPEEEATNQLQATRSIGWEQETALRMQPYLDTTTEFLNDIISTPQAPGSDYKTFKTACEAHITKFRSALALIPSQQSIIEKGLIFDLQTLVNVLNNLLARNIERLGGWWSDKSDLFAIVGFGSLQACASVCDIQAIKSKNGLAGVIKKW